MHGRGELQAVGGCHISERARSTRAARGRCPSSWLPCPGAMQPGTVPTKQRSRAAPPRWLACPPEGLCGPGPCSRIIHDLKLLEDALHLGARQPGEEQPHGAADALRQVSQPRLVLGGRVVPQRHAQHLVGAHDKPAVAGAGAGDGTAVPAGARLPEQRTERRGMPVAADEQCPQPCMPPGAGPSLPFTTCTWAPQVLGNLLQRW